MNENQPKKKEKNKAEKSTEETGDSECSEKSPQSYYYDDAHGYEVYQPERDDERED